MTPRKRHALASLLVLAAALALWKAVTVFLRLPAHVLPPPELVFRRFVELAGQGILGSNLLLTLWEILLGYAAGLVLGAAVGYLLARSAVVEKALSPYILVFQTAPKISLAPLFVLWFGLGILSKVVLIALVTFFPILLTMIVGVRSTRKDYYELLAILRARPWQRILKVELMNALPYLLTGMRVGLVLSVTAAIIGEMMGARGGLGFLLILGNEMYDIPMLFVNILVISLLSFLLDAGMRFLQERLLGWHESVRRGPA